MVSDPQKHVDMVRKAPDKGNRKNEDIMIY
jgi:hypothetical protein